METVVEWFDGRCQCRILVIGDRPHGGLREFDGQYNVSLFDKKRNTGFFAMCYIHGPWLEIKCARVVGCRIPGKVKWANNTDALYRYFPVFKPYAHIIDKELNAILTKSVIESL